ncbi:MAG: hypothetical protein AAF515_09605 [Pseudomonadota bacterium]
MLSLDNPMDRVGAEYPDIPRDNLERIREKRPVHQAKISAIKVYRIARYADYPKILINPEVSARRA